MRCPACWCSPETGASRWHATRGHLRAMVIALWSLSAAAEACVLPDGLALMDRPGRADPAQPASLTLDIEGDGTPETALPVVRLGDGTKGIAFCRETGAAAVIGLDWRLGPDLEPAYFDRMDYWAAELTGPVAMGATEEPPPEVAGDKLLLGIAGSSSVLVYWDGTRFTSYWQGD